MIPCRDRWGATALLDARGRWRTRLLCVVIALTTALALYRLQPLIADSRDAPATGIGSDYRGTIYGPNILVSEHEVPWDADALVPRFGPYPTPPNLPVGYVAYPAFARVEYSTGLTLFLCCSILLVAFGSRRIARSLGLSQLLAWLVASLVVVSPTHLYNVALGQTGAGFVTAVAFFAMRAVMQPRWWHHLEKWSYGVATLLLFGKPTVALTFLAANLAYERTTRVFWKFLAAAMVVGVGMFALIVTRSQETIGTVLGMLRASSTTLSGVRVNGMNGDRLDFVALLFGSPVVDALALAVVGVGLWWLNRLQRTTLRERLLIGIGLVTIGTYHHVYDSLPLLAIICATTLIWPIGRALLVALASVLSGWLYGFNAVREAIKDLIAIDYFALSARLIFVAVALTIAVTIFDVRRRAHEPVDPEMSWAEL